MAGQNDYFHLRIIDTDNILQHETFDPSRSGPLVKKIKKMGIFTNPILVAHVKGRIFMEIDGMNRLTATRRLKIPSILTQVVDYNDQDTVEVSTWCHLNTYDKDFLIKRLSKIEGLILEKNADAKYLRRRFISDSGPGHLCTLAFRDGTIIRCRADGALPEKVKLLHKVVAIYERGVTRDILPDATTTIDIAHLFYRYKSQKTVVIFPTFTRQQIMNTTVNDKELFPGGITRFIIKGRCLDVNLPIRDLEAKISEEEKNKKLKKFLKNASYRIYDESTIYFEG